MKLSIATVNGSNSTDKYIIEDSQVESVTISRSAVLNLGWVYTFQALICGPISTETLLGLDTVLNERIL